VTNGGAATCSERTCEDDGTGDAATCGTGATCSNVGFADGYTCSCTDDSYWGSSATNGAATCTFVSTLDCDDHQTPLQLKRFSKNPNVFHVVEFVASSGTWEELYNITIRPF